MTQAREASRVGSGRRWFGARGWVVAAAAFLLVVMIPLVAFVNARWPYRYRNVKPLLENVFASQITVTKYRRTYFPRPGFVADGLVLRRKTAGDLPPLGTAEHLVVQGGWIDLLLLRKRVELVEVRGLRVVLPPTGSEARQKNFPAGSSADFAGPSTEVEKLVVRDSQLEIQRADNGPLIFPVKKLLVHSLKKSSRVRYELDMTNALPTGHILAHGTFGPLLPDRLGDTHLSGDYTFDDVQLKEIGKLHGVLTSSGHFDNTLSSIACRAKTDTPAFAVGDGKAIHVSSEVRCSVNGLNGDVILNEVALQVGRTPLVVRGSVTGDPKTTRVELDVERGRVQDLLQPFNSKPSPVTGAVMLHAKAQLLPGGKGTNFLTRLHMQGSFAIPRETITDKTQQQKLADFSARARGDKESEGDADALSSLRGEVTVRDGVVTAQQLDFSVPGASANFHGTYGFRDKRVDMTGTLRMEKDISHVTTGFKSVLLKPLAPFFARKHAGAVVPIAVTGKPGSYAVSQNIFHTKH